MMELSLEVSPSSQSQALQVDEITLNVAHYGFLFAIARISQ